MCTQDCRWRRRSLYFTFSLSFFLFHLFLFSPRSTLSLLMLRVGGRRRRREGWKKEGWGKKKAYGIGMKLYLLIINAFTWSVISLSFILRRHREKLLPQPCLRFPLYCMPLPCISYKYAHHMRRQWQRNISAWGKKINQSEFLWLKTSDDMSNK